MKILELKVKQQRSQQMGLTDYTQLKRRIVSWKLDQQKIKRVKI